MASVFKREGAGRANRWYAKIKVGRDYKVIRLPAVYVGPDAIKKDKALHLAVDAEILANKSIGVGVEEMEAQYFVRKVISIGKANSGVLKQSVSDFFAEWFKELDARVLANKMAANSARIRRSNVNAFVEWLGDDADRPLALVVQHARAQAFLLHLEKEGASINTVKSHIASLGSAMKSAILQGKISKNPFSGIEAGGVQQKEKAVFTVAEAEKMLGWENENVRKGMALMLCTGMRISDALVITYENFDFATKTLKFVPDKQRTGKERSLSVPVSEKLLRIIGKGTGPVVAVNNHQWFRKLFDEAVSDLNLRDELTPHSSRHFFVSMLANAGISEEIRMKFVGHPRRSQADQLDVLQLGQVLVRSWTKGRIPSQVQGLHGA